MIGSIGVWLDLSQCHKNVTHLTCHMTVLVGEMRKQSIVLFFENSCQWVIDSVNHTPIILLQSDLNCSENLNTSSEPWRCQEFDSEVRLVPHGCPELHQDCRGFVSMFLPAVKSRVSRCGEFCSKLAILVPSRPAVFNSHCQIFNY